MDNAIITFIFTFLVVLIINFIGQRLIVNKEKVLDGRTLVTLLAQGLIITIILSFI
ncbi:MULTISPECIES: hypothetical protein [unclassified Peribacillus]|uniref:hypothetical protein n=1 Tax=unclassified Peribacillus TaxID=2675266 RepID=UPI001914977A|nr:MULTISPECIES: hypothetical protein [unclassified Peribacillus]MBK5446985.1 hypothetical protein [Peribacillus sp. TH24]MBK5458198.1 hypothetical protein [Peribacillus sp. TH27]MBK5460260.1 hypothetical protein [Peribacillus sp. TH27]